MKRIFAMTALSLGFLALTPAVAISQETAKNWTIKPCTAFGPLNATTTSADLVRLFGKENVQETTISGAEGETYPGAKLFSKEPEKSLEVLWMENPAKKTASAFIARGKKALWKTEQGITLGTTLKELEKLNGGPFEISGFDWDLGGMVLSWSSGTLSKVLPKGFGLQLGYANPVGFSEKEFQAVIGDKPLKSNHPILQKLNPWVEMMACYY